MGEGRCSEDPRFSSGRGIRNEHSYKYTLNAPLHEGICVGYRKPGNRSREGMAIRHLAGPRIGGSGYGHQGRGLAWQSLVLSRGHNVLDPPCEFPITYTSASLGKYDVKCNSWLQGHRHICWDLESWGKIGWYFTPVFQIGVFPKRLNIQEMDLTLDSGLPKFQTWNFSTLLAETNDEVQNTEGA